MIEIKNIDIEESWQQKLKQEFSKEYFLNLKKFLIEEKQKHIIFPKESEIFSAFNLCSFDKVKLVILGQDPYHGQAQAHGLCFSVPKGIKTPPSLVNIFKELKQDINFQIPNHGNLEAWAKQGVFLLNATLTVRANTAGSHQNKGWEIFTDNLIQILNQEKSNLVFLLWGKYAAAKEKLIDQNKHLVLKAAHPSPLSAYKGFFGCKHFSQANKYLEKHKIEPINWKL